MICRLRWLLCAQYEIIEKSTCLKASVFLCGEGVIRTHEPLARKLISSQVVKTELGGI